MAHRIDQGTFELSARRFGVPSVLAHGAGDGQEALAASCGDDVGVAHEGVGVQLLQGGVGADVLGEAGQGDVQLQQLVFVDDKPVDVLPRDGVHLSGREHGRRVEHGGQA